MSIGGYYVLDEHKRPVRTSDINEWAQYFGSMDRIVADTMIGEVRVSTVFLGLDHNWGLGPPILFETMIFKGKHDGQQDRCSTWKQAEAQHEKACALVRGPGAN